VFDDAALAHGSKRCRTCRHSNSRKCARQRPAGSNSRCAGTIPFIWVCHLQSENEELQSQLSDLQDLLRTMQQDHRERVDEVRQKGAATDDDASLQQQQALLSLELELDQLRRGKEKAEQRAVALHEQMASLTRAKDDELAELRQERDRALAQRQELQQQLAVLEDRVQSMEARIKAADEQRRLWANLDVEWPVLQPTVHMCFVPLC